MKKSRKHSPATNPSVASRLSAFFAGSQAIRTQAPAAGGRSFRVILLKSLLLLCLCGFLIMSMVLTVSLAMIHTTRDRVITLEGLAETADWGEYDCILVMGAGLQSNGAPSPMLGDRVTVACDVYRRVVDADVPLLMSGDHTGSYNEVRAMKRLAVELGIPSEQVFLDHEGYSTYESIYRAKYVYGAKKIVIVTQEYHLYRALHIARELGMEAVGVPADLRPYRNQSRYELRELLARYKDLFASAKGEASSPMDPPVSLTGDGNLTNGEDFEDFSS